MHCKSMTHSWKSVDGSLDRCYVAMADLTLKSDDRTDQRARISDQGARTESIVRGNHGGCTQVSRSKLRAFMCRPIIVLVPCLSTVLYTRSLKSTHTAHMCGGPKKVGRTKKVVD